MKVPDDSKYYGTKNAKTGDRIKIVTEPKITSTKFGDKLVCMIERNGHQMEWAIGNVSKKSLIQALGDESADWMKYELEVTLKTDRPMPYIDVEPIVEVK